MSCRSRLLLGFAIAAIAAQGCSSSDTSPSSPDSGGDSGAPMTCDAAALPLGGDAAGACTVCKANKCATELAKCAADCVCAPIEICIEMNGPDENLAACPDAVSASLSGSPLLTALTQCLDINCLSPCFPGSTGGDSEAGAESSVSDARGDSSVSDARGDSGVSDARGN